MSHLEDVKQTYFEHLIDSLKYATISSINRKKQSTLKRVFIHMVCILNI